MTWHDFITIRPDASTLDWGKQSNLLPLGFVVDANIKTNYRVSFASRPNSLHPGIDSQTVSYTVIPPAAASSGKSSKTETSATPWRRVGSHRSAFWRTTFIIKRPEKSEIDLCKKWNNLAASPRVYYSVVKIGADGKTPAATLTSPKADYPFLLRPGLRKLLCSPVPANHPMNPLSIDFEHKQLHCEGQDGPFMLRGINVTGLQYRAPFRYPPGQTHDEDHMTVKEAVRDRNRQPWVEAAGISDDLIGYVQSLAQPPSNMNVIRLVLNQDWVINGYKGSIDHLDRFNRTAGDYLKAIDSVISWAEEKDIYVILALHTLRLVHEHVRDAKNNCSESADEKQAHKQAEKATKFAKEHPNHPGCDKHVLAAWMKYESFKKPYNGHLPDQHSWLFWSILASRYKSRNSVLYDLCNEPHPAAKEGVKSCENDDREFSGLRAPPSLFKSDEIEAWWCNRWKTWASDLEHVIHTIAPRALVLIAGFGGPRWSSSLRDMPIKGESALKCSKSVIYNAHFYWDEHLKKEKDFRYWLKLDIHPKAAGTSVKGQKPLNEEAMFFLGEWGMETIDSYQVNRKGQTEDEKRQAQKGWNDRWCPPPKTKECPLAKNPPDMKEWEKGLQNLFEELAKADAKGVRQGFAGWTAWSTRDVPCVFREVQPGGAYEKGRKTKEPALTDFGEQFKKALIAKPGDGKKESSDSKK